MAKNISGQAPGGKRQRLAEILPLKAPLVVQIFPVYACNFKCGYCIYSLPKNKRNFISDKASMDFALYKKCIDELAALGGKIKVLRFVGIGEPLLHKDIVRMIAYARKKNAAQRLELLTNGLLLTPALSRQLVKAGLNRLVISLQGTSSEKYAQLSGAKLDFSRFLKNLEYFYKHKKQAQVYIKIIDCALEDKRDERRFYEIFSPVSDTLAVEHAVPIHKGIDYKKIMRGKRLTQFGLPVGKVKICPQPFFTLQVNPDGKVVPCYSFEYPQIMGDCSKQNLKDIWNGENFKAFRLKMLEGLKACGKVCAACDIIRYRFFPEDDLSRDAGRLKKIYA